MLKNITYICSSDFVVDIETTLNRLGARTVITDNKEQAKLTLSHKLIGDFVLQISLITDLDLLKNHLKESPVDLLIYDERGNDSLDADIALTKIGDIVRTLADQWGPDFLFPMSRTITILKHEKDLYHRIFELGRFHTKDIIVAPANTPKLIHKIHNVLKKNFKTTEKVGCALSGGGIEGFLYQVGSIHALQQCLGEKKLNQSELFSGISSGSIVASILAANIPLEEIILAIEGESSKLKPLKSSTLFDFAGKDITVQLLSNSKSFPITKPRKWLSRSMEVIPNGFFAGNKLESYIAHVLERFQITDDISTLEKELYIGATDQGSFEHIVFGSKDYNHVKISEAVRAECSLPPLYTPKEINGRKYIDGQVTRTANLELVVERGCGLVFIVNPMRPATELELKEIDQQGGIYTTIQVIKTLLSTRFESILKHVSNTFPDIDFIVFQPNKKCTKIMAGSPMKYRIRKQLVGYAYESTMMQILGRHKVYSAKLAKYGFQLKPEEEIKRIMKEDIERFSWTL